MLGRLANGRVLEVNGKSTMEICLERLELIPSRNPIFLAVEFSRRTGWT